MQWTTDGTARRSPRTSAPRTINNLNIYKQMFLLLVISAAILAGVWLLRKWNETSSYWAKRNVPHLPPHPVLGSLTFLMKQNTGLWMRDVYEHFKTPYVGMWLFWRPALIINSPEIARRVLVKDSPIFRDRFLSGGKNDTIGSLNLFTVNDPLWTSIRKRLSPTFTSAKLRHLQGQLSKKSKEFVQRIKMDMEKHKQVNLRMVFTDYTTDVIGNTSFGVTSDATLTGESPLRTVTKSFMKFTYMRGIAWCSIFFFPELVDLFRFTMFPKSATDYFRKVYYQILAERGGYDTDTSEYRDFFDALRKMKKESIKNNESFSEEALISQAAAFLQAGFDSTGSALTFCAYELAFHPAAQDKLYNELVELKRSIGEADLDADILKGAKYLNSVIKESLRKYQPMGWLDRIAAKDYEIDENLTIPAGTPVYINSSGMHYDPEYYPDPYTFNPDRFLPENEKKLNPFVFLPFGEGPRSCIGTRFALQNMYHVLANIVLNYKLFPKADGPLPNNVKIEEKGLFFFPGEDLHVEFVQRQK